MLLPGAKQPLHAAPAPHTTAGAAGQKTPAKGKPTAPLPVAPSRLDWQQFMGGVKAGKNAGSKKTAVAVDPELLTWPYADLQTMHDTTGADYPYCWLQCACLLHKFHL